MASSALEEKINKIRLQNEEIRRRYEEVEADKKNAAKLNALVQLVPSDDWPERKEPPEFSAPPKNTQKQKTITKDRENERPSHHYSGIQERLAKKEHKFAQGDGPPPDPKYNFLADSERETHTTDGSRADDDKNKSKNRVPRGGAGPKRRGGGNNIGGGGSRDAFFKDNRGPQAFYNREESLPEYEAWRAERNRIDEARINRQKTAEGNWRREWDCNKVSLEKDQPRRDFIRKDSNTYDRRNNHYENDYSGRGHGGSRTYHQSQKNYNQDYRHPHHEQPHEFKRQQSDCKTLHSAVDNRTVAAFDQSIKVTVNQGSQANKATVMSVKVNSPSIAGTGRVGPRQKSRITYSSQSDSNTVAPESSSFMTQKSFDEKTVAANFNNSSKLAPKSPYSLRKKEGNAKSPYFSKKEFKIDESARPKSQSKALYSQRNESRDQRQSNNFLPKSQRIQKRKVESIKTGKVSVVEDSVPVKNDINKPIDNVFRIQNNDSIECETHEIVKGFSDLSSAVNNSAIDDNQVTDDIAENVRLDHEDNVLYDNDIVDEENIDRKNADLINDQCEDAVEENCNNVKIDDSGKIRENPNPTQNIKSMDMSSYRIDESDTVETDNASTDVNRKSFTNYEENINTNNETILAAVSKPTITENVGVFRAEIGGEASVNIESLKCKSKEVPQMVDQLKNKNLDIEMKLEQKEIVMEEKYEQKIAPQNEEGGISSKEFEQSNTNDLKVKHSNVEDNSVNDSVEFDENTQTDSLLRKIYNDSGFLDVGNDSFNTTNTTEINDSSILSDNNIVEDLGDSLNESGAENKNVEISPESANSIITDITKDDCKKAVEICDNLSATSCDTLMTEGKQKVNEILENCIKNNDAKVTENEQQRSDVSEIMNSQDDVNTVKNKIEQVSEESIDIVSEE